MEGLLVLGAYAVELSAVEERASALRSGMRCSCASVQKTLPIGVVGGPGQ